jgi:uncharacterized protein YbdZ (MbtH family)
MSTKHREALLNHVLGHLSKMKSQSLTENEDQCVYLSPNGKRCAVGCLITKENYSQTQRKPREMRGVFYKIPIDVATTPKDGYAYTERFWATTEDGCVLFYSNGKPLSINEDTREFYPQCNSSESVTKHLLNSTLKGENVTVQKVPVVFRAACVQYVNKHWKEGSVDDISIRAL